MTDNAALRRLSDFVGIEPGYWDVGGRYHDAPDETRRALLTAMGFDAHDEDAATATLSALEDDAWRRPLAPVSVVRLKDGVSPAVILTLPEHALAEDAAWRIVLEDGAERTGAFRPADLDVEGERYVDGEKRVRCNLPLPGDLPLGYHHLDLDAKGANASAPLIAAPEAAYAPKDLTEGGARLWGVSCQLYALSRDGDWGMGDFSALDRMCADVAELGGAVVGIPPLHAVLAGDADHVSPYSPSSRTFLNTAYLDVERVTGFDASAAAQGRLADNDVASVLVGARAADLIDYPAVTGVKREILGLLFQDFERNHPPGADTGPRREFDAFVTAGGEDLHRFVLHEALREHFDGRSFYTWPEEYRAPATPEVQAFAQEHETRLSFYAFVQWQTNRQLAEVAARAADAGMAIGLYGDLAVGVSADGVDAWIDPAAYVAGARIGAPPDPFCAEGQEWGLPPLHPVRLRDAAYKPYIALLRANMRHTGALRIDHAMWLQHVFWIPLGGKGTDGAYVSYPLDDLLGILALESHRNACVVIAEDLGTVPEGFRERLAAENILAYRVLHFERYPDGLFKRPSTYPALALATPGSHDLPPLAGFWSGTDIQARRDAGLIGDGDGDVLVQADARARERDLLVAALADQGLVGEDFPRDADLDGETMAALIGAVHRFLARTPSALMMMNIEDILGLSEQVNIPGTVREYPNWRRRLPASLEDMEHTHALTSGADAVSRER